MCDTRENNLDTYKCRMLYCQACLSSDRSLYILNDYADFFRKICDSPFTMSHTHVNLCWECLAILKKIKMFETRVAEAQKILKFMHFAKNQYIQPNSLSNLTICQTDTIIDVTYEEKLETDIDEKLETDIDEKPETDIDEKPETDIDEKPDIKLTELKEENEPIEDELFETDFNNDDIKDEDLDQDQQTQDEPKSNVKNRNRKYKLVFDKKGENFCKIVRIDFEQAKCWMERDRNNDMLKKIHFKCLKCLYVWKNKKQFLEHERKFHRASSCPYTCDICSSHFKTKNGLSVHIKSHTKGLQCTICNYSAYSPSIMKIHLKQHKNEVQCLICDLRIENTKLFHRHYRLMHNSFICDLCGKRCQLKHTLERHMRNFHKFDNFECKICKRRYKSRKRLRQHMWLRHAAPKTAELAYCAPCDRQFDTIALYRQHVLESTKHAAERNGEGRKKKIMCPECPNVYSRKIYMMNHYKYVHMKQTNFYCSLCDRYFLNRTRYKGHMMYKHEGAAREKNKMCTVCGRGFNVTRTLVNHMRTHSGERPYECPHCERRFAQQYAMKIHVKNIHGRRKAMS